MSCRIISARSRCRMPSDVRHRDDILWRKDSTVCKHLLWVDSRTGSSSNRFLDTVFRSFFELLHFREVTRGHIIDTWNWLGRFTTRNHSVATVTFRTKCPFNERRSTEGCFYTHRHTHSHKPKMQFCAVDGRSHAIAHFDQNRNKGDRFIHTSTFLRCNHMGFPCSFRSFVSCCRFGLCLTCFARVFRHTTWCHFNAQHMRVYRNECLSFSFALPHSRLHRHQKKKILSQRRFFLAI